MSIKTKGRNRRILFSFMVAALCIFGILRVFRHSILRTACATGDIALARASLALGANIHIRDVDGATLVHIAVQRTNATQMLRLLLSRGADADVADEKGRTPLHIAALVGASPDALNVLFQQGVAVEAKDAAGLTPLHVAAEEGQFQIAQALLDQGAAPDILNKQTQTALALANARGHTEVASLIQQHLDPILTEDYFALQIPRSVESEDWAAAVYFCSNYLARFPAGNNRQQVEMWARLAKLRKVIAQPNNH
ncbi:MAG: ankyrin repeat domain-containing protein [Planctomycetes bacterium]|nr:ankyrin repeat domain-containing protein [Planctomycetota bacterium]